MRTKKMSVEELVETDKQLLYEDYQRIYYYLGISVMINRLKKQFIGVSKDRLNMIVKAILYGHRRDGSARDKPCSPDPYLMISNSFLYNFQGKVWKGYVRKMNKKGNAVCVVV